MHNIAEYVSGYLPTPSLLPCLTLRFHSHVQNKTNQMQSSVKSLMQLGSFHSHPQVQHVIRFKFAHLVCFFSTLMSLPSASIPPAPYDMHHAPGAAEI